MIEQKTTKELEKILGKTHPDQIEQFLQENADKMLQDDKIFAVYIHQILRRKGITQQEVFLRADIPERYGYKLLSEDKKTKQRDYIIRICYAARMDLEETQKALTLYGMAPLYPRIPRDAVLMIAFNQRSGDILCVNQLLDSHGMEPLRSCGSLD